jgi:hypothetical protein
MPEKSALGGHGSGGDGIVQRVQQVIDPMAGQSLDPQCSLSSGWQHDLDREELGNFRL